MPVIAMRGEGASATIRGLADKKKGIRGVACSEARLLGQKLEGERQLLAEDGGSADDSGRPESRGGSNVSCSSPSCGCAVATDEHDVGATTLRVRGPCTAWDAAKSVGWNCASNVESNQIETSTRCLSFLGSAAGSRRAARTEGCASRRNGPGPTNG